MAKTKRKSSEEATSSSSSSSKPLKKSKKNLVAAIYKQYGFGAVKTELTDKPKQAFRYTGLSIKREWPIRVQHTQKIPPVGPSNAIGPNSSLHFSVIIPANQFWR
jgi:hypothetical protein